MVGGGGGGGEACICRRGESGRNDVNAPGLRRSRLTVLTGHDGCRCLALQPSRCTSNTAPTSTAAEVALGRSVLSLYAGDAHSACRVGGARSSTVPPSAPRGRLGRKRVILVNTTIMSGVHPYRTTRRVRRRAAGRPADALGTWTCVQTSSANLLYLTGKSHLIPTHRPHHSINIHNRRQSITCSD